VRLYLAVVFFILASFLSAQSSRQFEIKKDTLLINLKNKYELNTTSIIPGSEILSLRGRMVQPHDYTFDYTASSFSLSDSLPYSILDTIVVTYRSFRINFKNDYVLKVLAPLPMKSQADTMKQMQRISNALTNESIFGRSIEKSGTLIRGFTVGTNKDMTLQSGFRLQLSGKLTDDIDLVAALTDENSPIQPEGNTERLDELDKVFIQVKHKNAAGTFGDYDLVKKSGEFGNINRKLQGFLGEVQVGNTSAFTAFATARGKFTSNSITGTDAVQGPYSLYGSNNESDITIIAGSERIYLNGELLKRGEQNDYTIDYSIAQITFTTNRLITSASRVIVEFEYTDRAYSRSLFAVGLSTSFLNNSLRTGFTYLREADNQDAPIDVTLSDSDKKILAAAGNEKSKAVKSGASLATPDSTGTITAYYEKVDTVINSTNVTFYRYNPGSSKALYNVTFSYIGSGKGSYVRDAPGNFRYAGANQATYDTVIFLPLPQKKEFADFLLGYDFTKNLSMNLELAGSNVDLNRFSSVDNEQNRGFAYNGTVTLAPSDLVINQTKITKIGGSWRERYTNKRFSSPERFGDVEFNRSYNVTSDTSSYNERLREVSLYLEPVKAISSTSSYGELKQESINRSTRLRELVKIDFNSQYTANYDFDYVKSENRISTTSWYRQTADAKITYKVLSPVISYLYEDKQDIVAGTDSLTAASLKYYEINPGLTLTPLQGLKMTYTYDYRKDQLPQNGKLVHESTSDGFTYDMDYYGGRVVQSNLKVSTRNKKYSDVYKSSGSLNSQVILVKTQTKVNPADKVSGDFYYEVSTQKTAVLQRVYVQVTKGTGSYKYVGDLNGNGVKDENEFEPTTYDGDYSLVTLSSDELYPVIDLKTSARLRYALTPLLHGKDFFSEIVKPLTFESYGRIEENSKEQDLKKIYLMQMKNFMKDSTTIQGTNYFLQSVYLFENDPGLSFRFQYMQQRTFNSYSAGIEKGFKKERGMRMRMKLVEDISNESEVIASSDYMLAKANAVRNRTIDALSFTSDFSYRPYNNVEVGFKIKAKQNTDFYPSTPTKLNENGQTIRINFSFSGFGRLRLEFERTELTCNTTTNYLPYELTGGNVVGKNMFGRVYFDYRISTNLQATANYEGRVQGSSKLIHTAHAEVRAFF
jgi:hypothetical protein